MRKSAVALSVATLALVAWVSPGTLSVAAATSATPRASVSSIEVCSLLTTAEVQRLLNYLPATSPGSPQPRIGGGACAWGTGEGESVGLSVGTYPPALRAHPCRNTGGFAFRVDGWVGCTYLEPMSGDQMTGFKGRYSVSIQPEVNVYGVDYQLAEETVISHVFKALTGP